MVTKATWKISACLLRLLQWPRVFWVMSASHSFPPPLRRLVRQRSANVILDRAYGRPSQVASDGEDNPLELLMQHLEGTSRGLPSQRQ